MNVKLNVNVKAVASVGCTHVSITITELAGIHGRSTTMVALSSRVIYLQPDQTAKSTS